MSSNRTLSALARAATRYQAMPTATRDRLTGQTGLSVDEAAARQVTAAATSTAPQDAESAAVDVPSAATWSGVLTFENQMTGDGRMIQTDALRWENLPLPLRYAAEDVGGHDGAAVVGRIEAVERDGDKITAHGTFDLGGEAGREAYRVVSQEVTNGVSVDLDDVSFEVRLAGDLVEEMRDLMGPESEGDPLAGEADEEGRVTVHSVNSDDEVMVTTSARVRAATLVAIPAFDLARIYAKADDAPDDGDGTGDGEDADDSDEITEEERKEAEDVAEADDTDLDAEEDPDADTIEQIDKDEAEGTLAASAEDVAAFNWVDDVGGLPKYIKRIAKHLRAKGMSKSHAIASAVSTCKRWCAGGGEVKADTQAKACAAIAEWEQKKARANADAAETVGLAASGGPATPPAEWFLDPHLDGPTALTVDRSGRIYGHVATWGACHIAEPQGPGICTQPPNSPSGYAYFHTGEVLTDEGALPCGRITLNTGHAKDTASASSALAHYDNTGTGVADVRAGEDSHGIWIAGALRPGVSDKNKRALRSSPLSGDWRRIGGSLELVAALAVNTAGFPIPRPHGLAASAAHGEPETVALIASGVLPPRRVVAPGRPGALSEEDLRYLKGLARREKAAHAVSLSRRARVAAMHAKLSTMRSQ